MKSCIGLIQLHIKTSSTTRIMIHYMSRQESVNLSFRVKSISITNTTTVDTSFVEKLFELRQLARSSVANDEMIRLYWPDMIISCLWSFILNIASGIHCPTTAITMSLDKHHKEERFRAVTQLPSMCQSQKRTRFSTTDRPVEICPCLFDGRVDITACETLWHFTIIRLLGFAVGSYQ